MGVFERLLRRSKATEEAPAVEARVAVEAEGSSEDEGGATAGDAGTATAEDVGIPRQQTPEQAADHEAGKGSPT
ncbi:hypothetical protein ACFXAW_08225 [Streptomyces sp. NPDC059445]|uniref:hypothetical protein n=1 Tax=Streptomyces sp. NPDC059445 TaxID=3346832 RepID=UPI00367CC442